MGTERIERVQRQAGVCRVTFASGRVVAFPLAMKDLFRVREGDETDPDGMEREVVAKGRPYALARLMQVQAARDHTGKELEEALLRQGYPGECALEAVREMERAGLSGDGRYCESLIRRKGKKEGRSRLAWEMRMRGVDGETARETLERYLDPEEEAEAALLQARKARERGTEEKKIFMSLARKGYSREICLKALRETRGALSGDGPEEAE